MEPSAAQETCFCSVIRIRLCCQDAKPLGLGSSYWGSSRQIDSQPDSGNEGYASNAGSCVRDNCLVWFSVSSDFQTRAFDSADDSEATSVWTEDVESKRSVPVPASQQQLPDLRMVTTKIAPRQRSTVSISSSVSSFSPSVRSFVPASLTP